MRSVKWYRKTGTGAYRTMAELNEDNKKPIQAIEQQVQIVNLETIRNKIYLVRGQKVMLDFELAEIYG